MPLTSSDLRERFRQVFQDKWAAEEHPQYDDMLEKFVFHMMDTVADLSTIADLLKTPGDANNEDFGRFLHRFFLHAVPHLVSAGQLYDYIPEIFPEQRGVHGDPKHSDGNDSAEAGA